MSGSGATPPNPESSMSYLGHSDNVLDLVGRLVSIHQHKQQQALSQLEGVIKLQQGGFPVDTKVFSKLVKQSKLPISTNPDDLKAWMSSEMDRRGGQDTSAGKQQAGGQQQGGQQGQVPNDAPDYVKRSMSKFQEMAKSGKPLDPGEVMKLKMDILAGRALEVENTKAATEKQKAENELTIENLRSKVGQGDNNSLGRLMAMGGAPMNVEFQKWNSMSEIERNGAMEIAAGHESQADLSKRETNIAESLITSGRFSDPGAAFQAAKVYATGGTLPADLQSKMKPFTFNELADQATLSMTLIQLGVPPQKLGQTMRAATAGGLENAFPKGLNPVPLQGLALQKEQIGLERERLKKETEIAARAALAEQTKAFTAQEKADLDAFKQLVEIKKAGGSVSSDVIKGAQQKAAVALGMEPVEVNDLFHFLTGGTHTELRPALTDEGKKTVDKFTGNVRKPQPSEFKRILDTMRGKKEEGI